VGSATHLVAAAIVREGGGVILVQQQGADDPRPYWALPGGVVEPGELLHEALVRECAEEAGVRVTAVGRLAYCAQIVHGDGAQTLAFVFEAAARPGDLRPADPDAVVLRAELVPLDHALTLIEEIAWAAMRDPLRAYLRGESPPGSVWRYRDISGHQSLVGVG
jgi:8-oxo-dGTP diphosphatase